MESLNFDEIFNKEDTENYNLFISKLKQVKENGATTREILTLIANYYEKNVTYNYDELQIVKIINYYKHPELQKVLQEVDGRINKINAIAKKGEKTLEEILDEDDVEKPYTLEEVIEMLDDAFMTIEGRPLSKRNRESFSNFYGKTVHINYSPRIEGRVELDSLGNVVGHSLPIKEKKEHDEFVSLQSTNFQSSYPAVYTENGMLKDAVCSTYPKFEKKICDDLGIKHKEVTGIGTTGHGWSLVYLEEEGKWVHFDTTMIKFYQDGWIKEHEPYQMKDWVTASTEEIFKMQPKRRITSIEGKGYNIDENNYQLYDIDHIEKIEGQQLANQTKEEMEDVKLMDKTQQAIEKQEQKLEQTKE